MLQAPLKVSEILPASSHDASLKFSPCLQLPSFLTSGIFAFLSDQCPFQPNFFSTKQHEANPNRSSSIFCFSLASPTYFHPLCFNGRPTSSHLSCQEHNFQMPLVCSGFCSIQSWNLPALAILVVGCTLCTSWSFFSFLLQISVFIPEFILGLPR